jgi:hypothetical protein
LFALENHRCDQVNFGKTGSLEAGENGGVMRSQIYVAGFLVAGLFAFGSSSFAGGKGSGSSGHEHHEHQDHQDHQQHQEHRQHHWHGRYYWYEYGPWYPGYPGYGSNYPFAYVATDEQKAEAKKCVRNYYTATQANQRRAAKKRYIAVQTLRPSKRQIADYEQKRREAATAVQSAQENLSAHWVAPESLKCMMIFDTQTKQFVGSNCYAVGTLPSIGDSVKFETFTAEFVGRGT